MTPTDSTLTLEVELDPCVGLASVRAGIPLVRSILITNNGASDLDDACVCVAAPTVAEPSVHTVSRIPAGSESKLDAVDLLSLKVSLLGGVEGRSTGELGIEVRCEDRVLASCTETFKILPPNEWAGTGSPPELLASFVLPGDTAVQDLLPATYGPVGYEARDPGVTRLLVASIHEAFLDEELSLEPVANLSADGARVRPPGELLEARKGTTLDGALLLAAAFERARLNALLLIACDRPLVGAWLEDDHFPEVLEDEVSRIRKRVHMGSLLVLDPGADDDLDAAVQAANHLLGKTAEFGFAVDLRAARLEGLGPLQGDAPERAEPESGRFTAVYVPALADGAPSGRLARWQKQLLDLTLRNRLLNYRETKKTVPLLCPDVVALARALIDGKQLEVQALSEASREREREDLNQVWTLPESDPLVTQLTRELSAGRLRSSLTEEELGRRLVQLYRAAKISLEEGGANTLFMALGFVRWFESPSSDVERLSPIVLLPLSLTRRSAAAGYRLSLTDEDPQLNVTLLQKLQTDFGIKPQVADLDPDAFDLDVILKGMGRTIQDKGRWEVLDQAAVGLFSFTKFLMWLDLTRRAERIKEHPVVEHLVERPLEAFPAESFPEPESLDAEHHPREVYCPLEADSSQLSAILAAANGRTFVLEGPPGTGKSQTITNLIAHALGDGKRVLFVSEKMAALDVVYRRLERAGLGPFCLELHSSKANKRAVLDQLQESLDSTVQADTEQWERSTEQLRETREVLNRYARVLHRPRSFGRSVYQGISTLVGLSNVRQVDLALGHADAVDKACLERLEEAVGRMRVAVERVGIPNEHAWRHSDLTEVTPALRGQLGERCRELESLAAQVAEDAGELSELLGLPERTLTSTQLRRIKHIASLLIACPPQAASFLSDWPDPREQTRKWADLGLEASGLRDRVASRYELSVFDLPLEELEDQLEHAAGSWWPLSWWRARKPLQQLRAACKTEVTSGQAIVDVRLARKAVATRESWKGQGSGVVTRLGRIVQELETDWAEVHDLLGRVEEIHGVLPEVVLGDVHRRMELRARWVDLIGSSFAQLSRGGTITRVAERMGQGLSRMQQLLVTTLNQLCIDEKGLRLPSKEDYLQHIRSLARQWLAALPALGDWCAWRRTRDEAVTLKLGAVVACLENGSVGAKQLMSVFRCSLYGWWIQQVFEAEPILRRFTSSDHEETIRRFRNLDLLVTEVSHELVQANVCAGIPRAGRSASGRTSSEMGVLRYELGKRRRHMPIRKLLEKIPNLLGRLKPCLLMSPLSVAQYLSVDFPPFDMVVFDEASQIPVWDSIGAIARGQALIVVGDPKQLPPTSFLQRGDAAEEELDEDDVAELESILDTCLAARLPSRRLGWHYRSQHEDLIAFSNFHYYDNRLLTFPAIEHQSAVLGVQWRHVPEGYYDRGKSRRNQAEAKQVVEYVLEHLRGESSLSIGVVTFSMPQQSLIEDLLDEAIREDEYLEARCLRGGDEPLFVKNLENVQGDERDIMLFSICYGPDQQGRVAMNFGPLNRVGGERRLNVAITRARRQVIVFSTLTSDHIDLARTRALGARHLKAFLEYAERGPAVLGQELTLGDGETESPLEESVRSALVERGWEVDAQVGCSGYRIDLAVKDPKRPGCYLLGVECDGAMYHSAKTARDRDRLRAAVLEQLGWSLHRIWSTDWWQWPDREMEKIEEALQQALDHARARAERAEEARRSSELSASTDHMIAPQIKRGEETMSSEPEPIGTPYQETVLAPVAGDDVYDPRRNRRTRTYITQIIEREAPIAFKLMARRIMEAYELQKLTKKLERHLESLCGSVPHESVGGPKDRFLWREGQDRESYAEVRVPTEVAGRRKAQELPPEEIANAAHQVLKDHISIEADDLARETARVFGIQRLGKVVKDCMNAGIDELVRRGGAHRDGTTVRV